MTTRLPDPAETAPLAVELVRRARAVTVVTHLRPDGDAIGSLLGLGLALRRLGKDVTMACDDGVPGTFTFLPGAGDVVRTPQGACDLLVLVDCGDLERGGKAAAALVAPERPILNVDHHVTNTRFGTVNWVDPGANSCAELVLELCDRLDVELDRDLATCLMTGVITDTQGFRTSSVNPRALHNAARLAAAGAPTADLAEQTLNRRSFSALCLWAKALGDMQFEQPGLVWTHVTQAMRRTCGIPEQGETGLANFLLNANEAMVTAVFIERTDGHVEISFRARPGFDVSSVAQRLGGGGHPPAAGCMLAGDLAEVEARALVELRKALTPSGDAGPAQRQAQEAGDTP
jgi:phosphoesterase RecJ-like protein